MVCSVCLQLREEIKWAQQENNTHNLMKYVRAINEHYQMVHPGENVVIQVFQGEDDGEDNSGD